jgi:PPM family protein phosphatase
MFAMEIESFGVSDVGLSRINNEDVWAQMPKEQFFILADGMGGHNAGEVAANETVCKLCQSIKEAVKKTPKESEWLEILKEAIERTNAHVYRLSQKNSSHQGMGTTLCLALFVEKTLFYAHVGDSRIYRLRKGRLTQLTQDHSLVDELIARGDLDPSDARIFPHKNVITRAIGTLPRVDPDLQKETVHKGDLYLLCSDGLSDPLPNHQIQEILEESPNLQKTVDALILGAKMHGGGDNITALLLKIR